MTVTINPSTGVTFADSTSVAPSEFAYRFGEDCGLSLEGSNLLISPKCKFDDTGFWTPKGERFTTRPIFYYTPYIVSFGYRGNAGTLTIPAHNVGDLILWSNGNRTTTAPGVTAGYTNIQDCSTGYSRSFRWQYRISATGASEVVTTEYYGYYAVIRNCTGVNASAAYIGTGSGGTIPLPTMSGCLGTGYELILAAPYAASYSSSAPSPYTGIANSTFAYISGNSLTTITPGAELDVSATLGDKTISAEFLPVIDS